jgi:predicted nicotinamide N-methyase
VSLDETVDSMFEELDRLGSDRILEELCPYFGVVWPAAQALTEWMAQFGSGGFAGRQVLELGCGLALPSFLASRFGAKVTAADLHPDVPKFLKNNLAQNAGIEICFQPWDWRDSTRVPTQWDWILASDVLYEKEYPEALVKFLERHLAIGGRAVISDPQRPYAERFENLLSASSLQAYKVERPVLGSKQNCVLFIVERV